MYYQEHAQHRAIFEKCELLLEDFKRKMEAICIILLPTMGVFGRLVGHRFSHLILDFFRFCCL